MKPNREPDRDPTAELGLGTDGCAPSRPIETTGRIAGDGLGPGIVTDPPSSAPAGDETFNGAMDR